MSIANIAANNGWAMAFLGAGIVMTGLVVLALAISQIHKLVDFWEKRQQKAAAAAEVEAAPDTLPAPAEERTPPVDLAPCPINMDEIAALYRPLTEPLGSPFELKDLYRLAGESDLPHPHITIRCFREAGLLTIAEEGLFVWKD